MQKGEEKEKDERDTKINNLQAYIYSFDMLSEIICCNKAAHLPLLTKSESEFLALLSLLRIA